MRSLTLGIYAEGPTDPEFLSPLILRMATELISVRGHHLIDIPEPAVLPGRPASDSFHDTMTRYGAACNIVVVHTDGAGQPERAREERIRPWFASVVDTFDDRQRCLVAAVPVRETEAWMVCDTEALNAVFGTRLTRDQMGLGSRPHEVEAISDPKLELDRVHQLAPEQAYTDGYFAYCG